MAKPLYDVTIKGMALSDRGLTDWNTYDGFGLVTFGFIWGCGNIWFGPYYSNGTTLSTTWTICAGGTLTTWTICAGASVATTWTLFTTYNIEDC